MNARDISGAPRDISRDRVVTIDYRGMQREVIDLGSDHWWAWLVETEGDDSEPVGYTGHGWFKFVARLEDGEDPFGGYDFHLHEGDLCFGYVSWRPYSAMKASGHTLLSASPLTISPSLACRGCPSHGFIRDGLWVDA